MCGHGRCRNAHQYGLGAVIGHAGFGHVRGSAAQSAEWGRPGGGLRLRPSAKARPALTVTAMSVAGARILAQLHEEGICMGTWGTGPFDNDAAADFADALDDAEPEEREALIRGVLTRTVNATGWLIEEQEAVAAAALVAAQCPGGDLVDTADGPEEPMPVFSDDLRELADKALARIMSDETGSASNWVDPEDGKQWQAGLNRLRAVLAPPERSIPLFDVGP